MQPGLLALAVLLAPSGGGETQDLQEIGKRIEDPAGSFPAFQELLRGRQYGLAHKYLLSARTKETLPYEAFLISFTAFEAPHRLIAATEVHRIETVDESTRLVRLCGPEFGVGRDVRLTLFNKKYWVLDLTGEDFEYLKGRALGWFRRQVRKADGWHFAYPPDWSYAPVARTCKCSRRP